MPDQKMMHTKLHHRGRLHQIPIYLGKQLRSFLYVSDWKVLPMAGIIAALVSMVIRKHFFITMEGTLLSAFAMACVAIWNGCFNSIQVICRERNIIKREHRGGMHITSYVISSMIYQALLCVAQTAITLYVCKIVGVKFPDKGFMTPWMILDIGITVFLISYASDMLSLFVSSIAHSTTTAMTVMPFLLIFQLVFSGSVIPLPAWAKNISTLTISNYGLTAITAQADYNNLPMTTGWTTLVKMENSVVDGDLSVGMIMDVIGNDEGLFREIREKEYVIRLDELFGENEAVTVTAGETVQTPAGEENAADTAASAAAEDENVIRIKASEVIDLILDLEPVQNLRGESIHYHFRVGDVMDAVGRTKLQEYIQNASAKAMYNEAYARSTEVIWNNWMPLIGFICLFALLSMISLEFIDKDKR